MTERTGPRKLLASDLDGTLIAVDSDPGPGVARFRARMREAPEVALAYVTGRHLALARDGVRAADLPEPSFLVCDVGTSIHERSDDDWRNDDGYRMHMHEAFGEVRSEDLQALLGGLDLTLQEPERQGEFKVSFEFPVERSLAEVESSIHARLEGLPVRAVVSRGAGTGIGLVDLLPAGVAKDTAIRHLRDRLGLTDDDVLFAGDTGNDRDALLGGWYAVLVGNAEDGFRRDLAAEAESRGLTDRLHLATGHEADGVLEACDRFGFLRGVPREPRADP